MNKSRVVLMLVLSIVLVSCTDNKVAVKNETTITITGEKPSCTTCSIVAESIAYLPHPDDTLSLVPWMMPERDSRGRYYAANLPGSQAIHVFGPNGRLLETFGKPGSGPAEFSGIMDMVVGLGDTLFVFEARRILVFSPEHQYVREFSFTKTPTVRPNGFVRLANGNIVMPAAPNHFTTISATGTLDSVSAADPKGVALLMADTTTCGQCGIRAFGNAVEPGTIWSGSMNQYVVERHDLSGKFIQRIVREAKWYPKWDPETGSAGDHGMEMEMTNESMMRELKKSRLSAIEQGTDGTLWLFTATQNPDDPMPANTNLMKAMMTESGMEPFEKHFVTIVEAIDPAKGELLATTQFVGMLLPVSGLVVAHATPEGNDGRFYKILQLRLTGR